MDYNELAEDLLSGCEENCADCKYAGDSEFECTIAQLAATAITHLIQYKDAIDRMGEFGKLFLQYSGDPRGMIGEAGHVEAGDVVERAKECVMHYETITDVDGNVWRPVLEDKLQFLICCMTELAEKAESERDAAVSLCGKLISLCSPPKEWRSKLFRRHINRPGDYMGCGYDFLDSFNRIFDEFAETADVEIYTAIRGAAEKEILERTRRMLGRKEE